MSDGGNCTLAWSVAIPFSYCSTVADVCRSRFDTCSGCPSPGVSMRSFCTRRRARKLWMWAFCLSIRVRIRVSRIRRFLRHGGRSCWNGGLGVESRLRIFRCAISRGRRRRDDSNIHHALMGEAIGRRIEEDGTRWELWRDQKWRQVRTFGSRCAIIVSQRCHDR